MASSIFPFLHSGVHGGEIHEIPERVASDDGFPGAVAQQNRQIDSLFHCDDPIFLTGIVEVETDRGFLLVHDKVCAHGPIIARKSENDGALPRKTNEKRFIYGCLSPCCFFSDFLFIFFYPLFVCSFLWRPYNQKSFQEKGCVAMNSDVCSSHRVVTDRQAISQATAILAK
jgi:hypothetical protein